MYVLLCDTLWYTESYSAVSGRRNPERKWHQEWQKDAWNDEGVHVEAKPAPDRHRIYQLGELQWLGFVAIKELSTFPRGALHQRIHLDIRTWRWIVREYTSSVHSIDPCCSKWYHAMCFQAELSTSVHSLLSLKVANPKSSNFSCPSKSSSRRVLSSVHDDSVMLHLVQEKQPPFKVYVATSDMLLNK